MLRNQLIQKIIKDISKISRTDCAVFDIKANCLSSTFLCDSSLEEKIKNFIESDRHEKLNAGNGFFAVFDGAVPVYVLYLFGDGQDIKLTGRLAVSQFENLIATLNEKNDRNRFIQRLLQGDIPKENISEYAKKIRIETKMRRVVLLIESGRKDTNPVLEITKGLITSNIKDFVLETGTNNIILIKALKESDHYAEIESFADILADTLETETMGRIRVSFGNITNELSQIISSYHEAQTAMEIGKVFYEDRRILSYKKLGIGRLIHQIPKPVCRIFLDEAFGAKGEKLLDNEDLSTVYAFFDNNLNISETARHLFVHRNTLSYRLDKIQKKTGLDVRSFDDAVIFKLAMMVESHVRHLPIE